MMLGLLFAAAADDEVARSRFVAVSVDFNLLGFSTVYLEHAEGQR